MTLARQPWFLILFFALLLLATRLPLAPGQLFTFDDVNLAYAMDHFDIRMSQPHPPGYPLFVAEMRVLWWLRFRRPESILLALSLGGSLAALTLIAVCGNRMFGGISGFCAACLMLFHPVFWHAGLTSALRVQLAAISMAVGWSCWQAWRGQKRWVLWSALTLGLGAGIRPEIGPLLFPLWVGAVLRAPASWRDRAMGLAAMAAAVALWLAPAVLASGGPAAYVKACTDYLSDQASVSSGLFGASQNTWRTAFWHLMVWTFSGVLGWGMAIVLAWRRYEGWDLQWNRLAFLALWIVPPFAFAAAVHLEDPGHTLAMSTVVALMGGYLLNRALENCRALLSRWALFTLPAAALAVLWLCDHADAAWCLLWTPLICVAAGLLLQLGRVKNFETPPAAILFFLLAPAAILNTTLFFHPGWYYRGASTAGWRVAVEHTAADVQSAFALTSFEHIQNTLATDDHTLRQIRRLAAERPGRTVVIWEHGPTAWRKAAYYLPDLRIFVLDHQRIQTGSPPVVAVWQGPRLEQQTRSTAPVPVQVSAGARIVWVLNPATPFHDLARRTFLLAEAAPVYYTDLPVQDGSQMLGEYLLQW